jgi:phosphatidylserine/phosphatidylglycerophosphate/cardiolipin synthase-like enzyme
MNKIRLTYLVITLAFVGISAQTYALNVAPVAPQIEAGFSPDGDSQALVDRIIQSAQKTIRLSAYTFTSRSVTNALIDAQHRGVDVAIIVDYKSNMEDDRNGTARRALDALNKAGVTVRTISNYPIHHDKFIVADGLHVETGSFNYSYSAAEKNSENVLVVWNNPQLAASYLKHWNSRFDQGVDYQ